MPLWGQGNAALLLEDYRLTPQVGLTGYPTGLRLAVPINNGASANTNTLTVPIPAVGPGGAVQVGDQAVIAAECSNTATAITTPTGWTLLSTDNPGATTISWLLTKSLTSGDITAGSVSISFSVSTRLIGLIAIAIGGNGAGITFSVMVDSAVSANMSTPSLAVPANALALCFELRRNGSTPATPLIEAPNWVVEATSMSAFGTANELTHLLGAQYVPTAATVGGEGPFNPSGIPPTGMIGTTYVVSIPLTTTATWSDAPVANGVGTASLDPGSFVTHPGTLSAAGTGTASLSGLVTEVGTLTAAGTGTAGLSGSDAEPGTLTGAGTGTASLAPLVTHPFGVSAAGTGTASLSGVDTDPGALTGTGTATGSLSPLVTHPSALTAGGVGGATVSGFDTVLPGLSASGTGGGSLGAGGSQSGALTAAAVASAQIVGLDILAGLATAQGVASAALAGLLTVPASLAASGVGTAAVTAAASSLRDITLTVGVPTARTLTAGLPASRTLTAGVPAGRTLTGATASRTLAAGPPTGRTLTGRLET